MTDRLDWALHCSEVAKKAGTRASLIIRAFRTKSLSTYSKAFTSLVSPILEYASAIWSPHYIKDVNLIENVQRSYTRRVFAKCGLPPCSYPERLSAMGLATLEQRRYKADLVLLFRARLGLTDIDIPKYFREADARLRGPSAHLLQPLINPRIIPAQNFWSNRVAPLWNSLPEDIVCAPSVHSFKEKLKQICVYSDLGVVSKIRS